MPLSQIVSASIEDGAVAPVDLSSVAQYTGFKNRLINGGMVIDQRNNGASVNMASVVYPIDRWVGYEDTDGSMTAQRSSVAPAGFINSILVTTTSADASLAATQYARIFQNIEGLNLADLGWGTASAETVTLSFWVRSSLTGTFGGAVHNNAFNRSYPFTYTISAANTWEQKTVTIPGDTTGTWLTNNGNGLTLNFSLGTGSTYSGTAGAWAGAGYLSATGATSVVGTNAATFYITGVQLEKGVTATSFDYRPYGTELSLCQRYYWKKVGGASASTYEPIGSGGIYSTPTNARIFVPYPMPMRAIPTFSTNGTLYVAVATGNLTPSTISSYAGLNSALIDVAVNSSTMGYAAVYYTSNTTSDYFQASAEL